MKRTDDGANRMQALAWVVVFGLAGDEVGEAIPVTVGDGPLLFMMRSIEKAGEREDVHLVVNPEKDATPRPFLNVKGYVRPVHRFGRNLLLMEDLGVPARMGRGLFFLHLGRGKTGFLLKDRRTALVKADERSIVFLEVEREAGWPAGWAEYKLGEGDKETEDAAVISGPEPRYRLRVQDADPAATSRVLWDAAIERVLEIRDDGLWVITAKPSPAIWRLSPNGKERLKIVGLEEKWVPSLLSHRFSPNGKKLALGVAKKNRFFKTRDLVVVDVRKRKVILELKNIPVQVHPFSSFSPWLAMVWLDDERILFSETKVTARRSRLSFDGYFQWWDLDVPTGKRLR